MPVDGQGVLDEQVVIVEGSIPDSSWTVVTVIVTLVLLCVIAVIQRYKRS